MFREVGMRKIEHIGGGMNQHISLRFLLSFLPPFLLHFALLSPPSNHHIRVHIQMPLTDYCQICVID